MFKYYLPISSDVTERVWKDGKIIFDTNVLLNLYRHDIQIRDKLLNIIENDLIAKRLWIPAKVFEEFLKNRATVICEQWSTEEKINAVIESKLSEIQTKINSEIWKKYHPYINREKINSALEQAKDSIKSVMHSDKQQHYAIDINDDYLLSKILSAFEGKIGEINSAEKLTAIYAEGKTRYKEKIPPGFMDEDKGEPEMYSDLVIWKNIIEFSKDNNDIIFVTDDKKIDWIRKEHGKTVGPNPILVKEFHQESNGKEIIIVDSRNFFKHIDDFITKRNDLSQEESDRIAYVQSFEDLFSESYSIKPPKERIRKRSPLKQTVIKWFFDNYKDPADGVPHDSGEGGYIYCNGGPYDAEEEIIERFPNINPDILRAALDEICEFGFEWVKNDEY